MKNKQVNRNPGKPKARAAYKKPRIERIKLDKNISMVMMSGPPGDPGTSIGKGFKFPFNK